MINPVFGKTVKNVRKRTNFKNVPTERKRKVSQPNYHTTKQFSKNSLATEMIKSKSSQE